jgi:hypothetical protein
MPGLVIRDKTYVGEVVGSNHSPAVKIIYHAPLVLIKSMKVKIVEKDNLPLLPVLYSC